MARKAMPAELAAALIESLPDAVIACDSDGVIVTSNRQAHEILGASDEGLPEPLARALRGEEVRGVEVEVGDGQRKVLSVTGGPLRDSDGETVGAVVVAQDVTERVAVDERLRLQDEIAASLPAGIGLVRASDGQIVRANEAWQRMVGYAEGELVGRHLSNVTAPGRQAPELRAREIARALEQGGVWSGEIRNVRKDGTRFWCAASIAAFEHPEHGPTWILVETDISRRKATEEALRLAEERFRNVFEEAPVGIALIGNDQRLTDTNQVLSEITGYSRDELVGKTLADITHPDDVEVDASLMAKVFRGEIPRYQTVNRYMTKQGDVIAVAFTSTCVRDAADRPLHCIAIVEPLTAAARG
jgi:PAS domain S-box-containing protein